jgi:hypothetical protein
MSAKQSKRNRDKNVCAIESSEIDKYVCSMKISKYRYIDLREDVILFEIVTCCPGHFYGYPKRLRSLRYRYIKVFAATDKDDLDSIARIFSWTDQKSVRNQVVTIL